MQKSQQVHSPKSVALIAVLLLVLTLAIYWSSAVLLGRTQTPDTAYFNHLADSFLQGRTYLINPPATHDLTEYQGKWYVPFPPLPALLLIPWVAVSGATGVNTVLFGALMGAVNVALVFLFLQALAKRGWTRLTMAGNLWLSGLLGVGSVHWYMSTLGSVWFVSQICTLTFILLAAWIAVAKGSAWLTGSALALAMLGRPNVALTFPFLLAIGIRLISESPGRSVPPLAQDISEKGSFLLIKFRNTWTKWRNQRIVQKGIEWGLLALLPMAISAALLLGYNFVRFDNALDFGYLAENVAPELAKDLHTYGQFSLRYLGRNLWAMLCALPEWNEKAHQFLPTINGMSLLLTTPALLYVFRSPRRSILSTGAWLAFGMLLVPLLTYYNTGWWQFGYRFSLDFMTPLIMLVALSAGQRVDWKLALLILLGVLVNAWGAWWFLNPRFFG